MTAPISVVDFFSGCGGTSLGFRQAGLSIAVGIDNDPLAAQTFRHNFPEARFLETDVTALTPDDLAPFLPEGPLLFSGCAPCQPFSRQNNARSPRDPRRGLLAEFGRMVTAHRPQYVVVENVPGIQRPTNSTPLTDFVSSPRAPPTRRSSVSQWRSFPAGSYAWSGSAPHHYSR
jgi:DNA (cytosine-5)-methyltransferase 1